MVKRARKNLNVNDVQQEKKYLVGLFIVALFICFIIFYIVQYYQLLVGDDVLGHYKNGLEGYLGNGDIEQYIRREKNIKSIIEEAFIFYTNWGGRLIACAFNPLLYIFGQRITSICGAIVYTSIILLIGRLAWGRWREVFEHPFEIVFVAFYLYIAGSTGTYMQMWTFVCNYAIPTMMCLMYLIKAERVLKQIENLEKGQIICTCILGFFVGIGHELLGAYLIIVLFLMYVKRILIDKKSVSGSCFLMHIGFAIGYCICFFAPGNWVRMTTQHDEARISTDVIKKISTSVDAHYEALIGGNNILRLMILLVLALIVIGLFFDRNKRRSIIEMVLAIMFLTAVSIVLWALVAPPVPQYGVQLWKATILVCLLRCIPKVKGYCIISLLSVVLLFTSNYSWCKELIQTTEIRRMQISEAVENGEECVYVKKYSDVTANYLTWGNLQNYDNLYTEDIIKDFYGVKIIPR